MSKNTKGEVFVGRLLVALAVVALVVIVGYKLAI